VSWALHFDGLEEFKAELRRLPERLRDRAADIIENKAEEAKSAIFQAYPRGKSGNLREGLSVEHHRSAFGAQSIVRNKAKHAYIYENGSEARKTSAGWPRGSMPPGRVFIRIIIKKRREMEDELGDMMQAEGLIVSRDAA
jgi:hypothetical protein